LIRRLKALANGLHYYFPVNSRFDYYSELNVREVLERLKTANWAEVDPQNMIRFLKVFNKATKSKASSEINTISNLDKINKKIKKDDFLQFLEENHSYTRACCRDIDQHILISIKSRAFAVLYSKETRTLSIHEYKSSEDTWKITLLVSCIFEPDSGMNVTFSDEKLLSETEILKLVLTEASPKLLELS
jgi:hypothetical protein